MSEKFDEQPGWNDRTKRIIRGRGVNEFFADENDCSVQWHHIHPAKIRCHPATIAEWHPAMASTFTQPQKTTMASSFSHQNSHLSVQDHLVTLFLILLSD